MCWLCHAPTSVMSQDVCYRQFSMTCALLLPTKHAFHHELFLFLLMHFDENHLQVHWNSNYIYLFYHKHSQYVYFHIWRHRDCIFNTWSNVKANSSLYSQSKTYNIIWAMWYDFHYEDITVSDKPLGCCLGCTIGHQNLYY